MATHWWTFALQVVNFLVLVWLLQRFLYRPVLGMIAKRQGETDRVMAEAAAARAAADNLRQDLEASRAGMAAERDQLIAAARLEAEKQRALLLDKARGEAEAQVAAASARIAREATAAEQELRQQAATLAVDLTRRMLAAASGAIADSTLLQQALDDLAKLDPADRAGLLSGGTERREILVLSATALAPAVAAECRSRLQDLFGVDVVIKLQQDPDLIAGVELHFPHSILRHNWRDGLAEALERIAPDANAG